MVHLKFRLEKSTFVLHLLKKKIAEEKNMRELNNFNAYFKNK